ncbi:related to Glutaredoxin-8 [Saccharomycodes ludwigii]|uniref:Related to Glutaredoxin-8 n=1 Tax=Saccharomycodes ludwigii TaxID=36035 RepID=A0A376B693_9ASCO|nr:hypothetical protein SCDLUD_002523 [Saccharomycodes ludwigii]KAH3901049.1 hypothetical protein SCDLUD_002523 [Saccharomycodes ludwigii]SSD60203.1 related to Glutaredoxin-8 [Saccharomycodes ludwigii]
MSSTKYVNIARNLVQKHKFFQLTASWCPDCRYTNNIWKTFNVQNKIQSLEIAPMDRIEADNYREAFSIVAGGIRNLPTVFVNGKYWCTEKELHSWESNGTLKQEFEKVGLL